MPIQLRFLRRLALQYFGWWVAIAVVPAVFLDHHRPSLQLVTAGYPILSSRFGWTAELKVSSTFKAKTHLTQVWIQYALHSLVFVGTPGTSWVYRRFRSKELFFQTTLLYNPIRSIHLFLSQPLRFYLPKHICAMVKTCETCPQWGMVISP